MKKVNEHQITLNEAMDLKLVHARDWKYSHRNCDGAMRDYKDDNYEGQLASACDVCTLVVVSTLSTVATSRYRHA